MIHIPQDAEESTGGSWVRDEGEYEFRVAEATEGVTRAGDPKIELKLVLATNPSVTVAYDTLSFGKNAVGLSMGKLHTLLRRKVAGGEAIVAESLVNRTGWCWVYHETYEGKKRNRVSLDYGRCGYSETPQHGGAKALPGEYLIDGEEVPF